MTPRTDDKSDEVATRRSRFPRQPPENYRHCGHVARTRCGVLLNKNKRY